MDVKKCDRCGTIYEEDQTIDFQEALSKIKRAIGGTNKTSDIVSHLLTEIDLCDECIDDFKEWLTIWAG